MQNSLSVSADIFFLLLITNLDFQNGYLFATIHDLCLQHINVSPSNAGNIVYPTQWFIPKNYRSNVFVSLKVRKVMAIVVDAA